MISRCTACGLWEDGTAPCRHRSEVDGAYFQSYCSFQLFHHFFYGVSYVVVGRAIRAATLLMSMALAFLFEICGVWWVKRCPMLLRSLKQLRCFSSLFDPVGRVLSDTPGYPVTAGRMGMGPISHGAD